LISFGEDGLELFFGSLVISGAVISVSCFVVLTKQVVLRRNEKD